jgi:lysine-N-methylase
MQVDDDTFAHYQKNTPELLDAVVVGEAEHVMRRDPETDYCVKFSDGWCSIQQTYGEDALGDACYFFPRVTRLLGGTLLQTASLSCPEIARLALFEENSSRSHYEAEDDVARLPLTLRDYLPSALQAEDALAIHRAFLVAASSETVSVEQMIAQLHSVAQSLACLDMTSWASAVDFYLNTAATRLPSAESHLADPFNLFYALSGLVAATTPTKRPRLDLVLNTMREALALTEGASSLAEGQSVPLTPFHLERYRVMQQQWVSENARLQPLFRRWLQVQLKAALFPFSGFGDSLPNRVAIMGIRFATLKLALQCHLFQHQTLSDEALLTIAQSLSRFMDHLADPAFSVRIYEETGWLRLDRLRGIL